MNCKKKREKFTKKSPLIIKIGLNAPQKFRNLQNTQFSTETGEHFACIIPKQLTFYMNIIHMIIHFPISDYTRLIIGAHSPCIHM